MQSHTKKKKSRFESIKAKARFFRNYQELYKWSLAAGLTGLIGGLGGILFNFVLNSSLYGFNKVIAALPDPRLIAIVPAIGGLAAGIVRYYASPEAFEECCSTDNMIDIVNEKGGRAKIITPFSTIITSALTIGSGGSAGRECPTALIGTGFGSITAQIIERFHLDKIFKFSFSEKDVRILAICGAAAGLGAIFRAPIGAAFFSISVLYIYGMEMSTFIPAVISSIVSFLVFSSVYGFEPLFKAPFTWSFNFFDFGWIILIGLVASLFGLFYIKFFYKAFHSFRKLPIPDYLKPAIGGLVVGLIVIVFPRVFGIGYETIQDVIDYKITISLMFFLIFAKIVATSFSIGSGGSGGVIAPSLFVGAVIGGLMGRLAMFLFPGAAIHPALYVIASMGAFYSAVGKVPIATAILLSEATRNFSIILPLFVGTITGFLGSTQHTIYESQKADFNENDDTLQKGLIADIMATKVVEVDPDFTIAQFREIIKKTNHHGFPVTANGLLLGFVCSKDVNHIPFSERETTKISDIMSKKILTTYPDRKILTALKLLEKSIVGKVVVVDKKNPKKLLGIITEKDVIKTLASNSA